jgi:hypothetical protein
VYVIEDVMIDDGVMGIKSDIDLGSEWDDRASE